MHRSADACETRFVVFFVANAATRTHPVHVPRIDRAACTRAVVMGETTCERDGYGRNAAMCVRWETPSKPCRRIDERSVIVEPKEWAHFPYECRFPRNITMDEKAIPDPTRPRRTPHVLDTTHESAPSFGAYARGVDSLSAGYSMRPEPLRPPAPILLRPASTLPRARCSASRLARRIRTPRAKATAKRLRRLATHRGTVRILAPHGPGRDARRARAETSRRRTETSRALGYVQPAFGSPRRAARDGTPSVATRYRLDSDRATGASPFRGRLRRAADRRRLRYALGSVARAHRFASGSRAHSSVNDRSIHRPARGSKARAWYAPPQGYGSEQAAASHR